MNITSDNVKAAAMGLGLLVAGYLGYKAYTALSSGVKTAADAAATVGNAINPLNHDNIFAGGVNAVGEAVSDPDGPGMNADGSWTLGGWIYDITHADPMATPAKKETSSPPMGTVEYDAMGNVIGAW